MQIVKFIINPLAGTENEEYLFTLPETFDVGSYTLSFRLDSLTDVTSNVLIDNVTTGYMESVPEPVTIGLLLLGFVGLVCRKEN